MLIRRPFGKLLRDDLGVWELRLSKDMAIGTLYVEELRATMRGRFAWVGAGVILLAVGCVATVGTQDTWLDGYGIIAYFLVPLAFIPLTAVFLASPRANRFVESVFTAPVERRDWLTAKILVVITLASAYYMALVPMVLVYAHHVGMPLLLPPTHAKRPRIVALSSSTYRVPIAMSLLSLNSHTPRSSRSNFPNGLRIYAGRRKYSRHHHADLDQSGRRDYRRVVARRVGVSTRTGRGNVGSELGPTLDHRAWNRSYRGAACANGGYQL